MSSTVKDIKPHWSELPPTWRYVIGMAMQAGELVLKLGCLGAIATSTWVIVDQETNKSWGARFRKVSAVAEAVAGFYDDDFKALISKGDVIAGYTVNSGFGLRMHPIHQEMRMHSGIDLPTPEGVSVHAIGYAGDRVSVRCWSDPKGYGTVADMTSSAFPEITFRAAHLSHCKGGEHRAGAVVAKTGNTGGSTGAHLHWEQLQGGVAQAPQKGYLVWALNGRKPSERLGDTIALYQAIVAKESGGDHTAVNPDTGALGLGQVMPQNLNCSWDGKPKSNCGWDYDVLGRDVSPQEFLQNPEIQQQIVGVKLESALQRQIQAGHDMNTAVKRVAAEWYSGNPELAHDTRPQAGYESIKSYADAAVEKFNRINAENLNK